MSKETARKHGRKKPWTLLVVLSALAGLGAAAVGIHAAMAGSAGSVGTPHSSASSGNIPTQSTKEPAPLGQPPKSDADRGMVYVGLTAAPKDDPCVGLYHLDNSGQCSHGPDAAPKGIDISKDTPPIAASRSGARELRADGGASAPGASIPCIGDGKSGNRVQVLYVHTPGQNRFAQYQASFQRWAADTDTIYNASAAETGGTRHIRFLTDSSCKPALTAVEVGASELQDFSSLNRALSAKGYDRRDRKYLLFADSNVYCGIGTMDGDEQPGANNRSNFGPSYARVDAGCWNGQVAAHELGHNLGAVNDSAPHSTKAGHCVDEWDIMCYSDAPYHPRMQVLCPDRAKEARLDCNHDDYYNTAPKPGSYLATHWNVADNTFLSKGGGTDNGPGGSTGPTAHATQVKTTSAVLTWRGVPTADLYTVRVNGRSFGNVKGLRLSLTSLWPGTDYKVTVTAHTPKGTTKPGPAATFRTKEVQ
ncbi:reprolysin-like metallopeptidase [Streptomyces sp. NPDC005209]|uniref:fibronectin type III domain-containing protein n=1 Tax=Streptomyces sp. NPDC005209 TaxID=3156715 RepID=UPI0033A48AD7